MFFKQIIIFQVGIKPLNECSSKNLDKNLIQFYNFSERLGQGLVFFISGEISACFRQSSTLPDIRESFIIHVKLSTMQSILLTIKLHGIGCRAQYLIDDEITISLNSLIAIGRKTENLSSPSKLSKVFENAL